jgi:site-specific DNA recombinase
LGKRIEIDQNEARIIRRIFESAAEGIGLATIVDRLNTEGVLGTGGKRWTKTPVTRILKNERYLGRQIWGQQYVEHEPGTGRKIMRDKPRSEWLVEERPELRIVSDDLWSRAQETRAEVRKTVAPKRNLARGKDARFHSEHLFTGFAKCHSCGGAMTSVSGGTGSPRLGCRRSWGEGRSACPNRLTIRMKVAEPQILQRLQDELLEKKVLGQITSALDKALKHALEGVPQAEEALQQQLQQETQKLQNLITAIESGSTAPAAIMKAVGEREATIKRLEGELRTTQQQKPVGTKTPELAGWVETQLQDLAKLLKADPAKTKSEFRRLNLQLIFHVVEAKPRPHFLVKGQCDLAALVFYFVRSRRPGAVLDSLLEQSAHSRTPILLRFRARLPSVGATGRWRERGRGKLAR